MVPRQFFYPRVVIEFYHTMTSRHEANLTAMHFTIDDRPGILWASDIIVTLHLPVVLTNAAGYRQWLHPSTREMVRLLSMDSTGGSILLRRHLPQRMLLIDHVLRSNMFPLHHVVQRRGAILEVLYRISEGYWFSPVELIMTSLFHFEDRVHRRSLPRAESLPLLFPRLLCQVLEHMGSQSSLDWSVVEVIRPPLQLIDGGPGLELSIFLLQDQTRTSRLMIALKGTYPLRLSLLGSL